MAAQALYEEIKTQIAAGEPVVVSLVELSTGQFVVRWGVDSLDMLECSPDVARSLAHVLAEHSSLPSLVAMLRAAADVADRRGASLQ